MPSGDYADYRNTFVMHLSESGLGAAFSVPNGTIAMNTTNVEDFDRRIVNEFCHLLEKSKQLFNGLRDLPQYGHKQWQVCSFLNNFSLFRFVI